MRLDMTAYRMPSGVVIEDEKMLRSGLNTIIDVQAALIDSAEPVAEGAQYACVKISAGAEYAANLENAAIQKGADLAVAATDEILASVNVFQRALIEEINNVREAVTKTLLRGLEEAISQVQQKDWQAVIHAFMRLVKRAYIAQLYVAWADAKAHPLLMKKGTKAAPLAGVLGPTQPREPWQDVHVEIQGPAVDDVARNFIGRWNAAQKSYLAEADDQFKPIGPDIISGLVRIPPQLVPPQRRQGGGPPTGVAVRVLRSAPLKLCKDEARARGDVLMPGSGQQEIQTQMLNLIQGATDFVYIENQFFQTFFDKASFDVFDAIGEQRYSGAMKYMMSSPANQLKCRLSSAGNATGARLRPQNKIGEALGNRIAEAVRHGMPFHVYIVLPVHPEGGLNDVLIAGQVHWTMQSLVFGEHSLVNRVRRAIAAKRLCKRPLSKPEWEKALADAGKRAGNVAPYEQVTEEQWSKYLTLLNLRNCQIVGGVVRTEQIYIHSKLLIVDDRHVLLGSANINDRSLSGHRDSELAVMLFDSKQVQKPLRDRVTHVNDLARNLRMDLWKKHFAIGLGDGIVSAATEMIPLMETPAAEATIKAIQKLASRNADIYAKTFAHVPWSKTVNGKGDGASLWPVCPRNATPDDADRLAKQMPFHAEFWKSQVRIKAPQGLRGFFTQLPTDWTIAENNHPPHMSVMALT
jgi:phospholipase D1/2